MISIILLIIIFIILSFCYIAINIINKPNNQYCNKLVINELEIKCLGLLKYFTLKLTLIKSNIIQPKVELKPIDII